MNKSTASLGVLSMFISALSLAADYQADIQMSRTVGGKKTESPGKLYSKGASLRMEMDGSAFLAAEGVSGMGRQNIVILADYANGKSKTTVLYPERKTYMQVPASDSNTDPNNLACKRSEKDACLSRHGFRKIGNENVNGSSAEHWQRTQPNKIDVWAIPSLDSEMLAYTRWVRPDQTGAVTQMDVLNVKKGSLDASLFSVPSGYAAMGAPGAAGGMHGAGSMGAGAGSNPMKRMQEIMVKMQTATPEEQMKLQAEMQKIAGSMRHSAPQE